MKHILIAVFFVFLLAGPAWAGEEIPLEQVPDQARQTIQQHVADGTIEEVERDHEKGKIVYEVEYRDASGADFELKVSEDGQLLAKRPD